MDWGQHVSEISFKATKTLGFLRRNLAFAPKSTKEVAYKTLVRPKLEYAAPIWSPHSKLQINQIEIVQRTAACWTCRRWRNTSSVGEMLDELEWPSLEARRDQSSLLLFHKIHCGAVSNCLLKKTSIWPLLTGWKLPGHHIVLNTADIRNTVMPWRIPFSPKLFHIIRHCNSLPPSVANTQSTEELGHSLFKQKFSQKFLCCFVFFVLFFVYLFYQNFQIRTPWCNAHVRANQ